jgi:hypothetical protein
MDLKQFQSLEILSIDSPIIANHSIARNKYQNILELPNLRILFIKGNFSFLDEAINHFKISHKKLEKLRLIL